MNSIRDIRKETQEIEKDYLSFLLKIKSSFIIFGKKKLTQVNKNTCYKL